MRLYIDTGAFGHLSVEKGLYCRGVVTCKELLHYIKDEDDDNYLILGGNSLLHREFNSNLQMLDLVDAKKLHKLVVQEGDDVYRLFCTTYGVDITYGSRLGHLVASSGVTVSGDEVLQKKYAKLEADYARLAEKNEVLQQSLAGTVNQSSESSEQVEQLRAKVAEITSKFDALTVENKKLEEKFQKIVAESESSLASETKQFAHSLKDLQEVNSKLEGELNNLREGASLLESKLVAKEQEYGLAVDEKDKLSAELVSLKDELAEKSRLYEECKANVGALEAQLRDYSESSDSVLAEKETALAGSLAELEVLKGRVSELENELVSKQEALAELEKSLVESKESIEPLTIAKEELEEKLKVVSGELEESRLTVEKLTGELGNLNSVLQSKEAELNGFEEKKAAEFGELEKTVAAEREKITTLNATNADLKFKIIALEQSLKKAEEVVAFDDSGEVLSVAEMKALIVTLREGIESAKGNSSDSEVVENYKVRVDELELELENLKKVKSLGDKQGASKLDFSGFKYNSKAKLIGVFGSGPGVTTTGVSLAKVLSTKGKVLYLDLDLTAPKANKYFKKTPVFEVAGRRMSGVDYMLQVPTTQFANALNLAVIKVSSSGKGACDYFGGLMNVNLLERFKVENLENALNIFGATYDYIVVGLGKYGYGGLGDDIVGGLMPSFYNVVCVTTNHTEDILNLKTRLDKNIDFSLAGKIVFLLNMVVTTANKKTVDEILRGKIYTYFLFDSDIFGHGDFMDTQSSSKAFVDFVGNVLGF